MSMNSENLVYFKDGHTEVIIDFDISKDGRGVWFSIESGRTFAYKGEYPECKFHELHINVASECSFTNCMHEYDVKYIATDEIEKIKIHLPH